MQKITPFLWFNDQAEQWWTVAESAASRIQQR